jgi:hypothetical protein
MLNLQIGLGFGHSEERKTIILVDFVMFFFEVTLAALPLLTSTTPLDARSLRGQVVRRSTSNAEIISSNLVEGSSFFAPIISTLRGNVLHLGLETP